MADGMEINVRGLRETLEALEKLPANIENNALRAGLRAGAGIVRKEARRLCISKDLRKSIIAVQHKRRRGLVRVSVGIKKNTKKFRIAHLIEFGTALRQKKSGASTGVMRARPFMRPAYEATKRQVLDAIVDKARQNALRGITRANARMLDRMDAAMELD